MQGACGTAGDRSRGVSGPPEVVDFPAANPCRRREKEAIVARLGEL